MILKVSKLARFAFDRRHQVQVGFCRTVLSRHEEHTTDPYVVYLISNFLYIEDDLGTFVLAEESRSSFSPDKIASYIH